MRSKAVWPALTIRSACLENSRESSVEARELDSAVPASASALAMTMPQGPAAAALNDSLLAASIAYTLDPVGCAGLRVELRRLLTAELYARWTALIAYTWLRWHWCAAYPELAARTESALAEARLRLLEEEPRLAMHMSPADSMQLELPAVLGEHGEEGLQLRPGIGRGIVQVDQLLDLLQRQAEPLAAQRELQPRAVALRVDALAAGAGRFEQADVLVEADRARRDVELARQLGDRVRRGERSGGRHRRAVS